ncbi:MAG: copper resistance CopC family protein [Ornithinimicrobium sp.]
MSGTWRGVIRALAGSLAALTLVLLGPVSGSYAHDELVESEPAAGVEVQTSPEEVVLEFSGDIAPVGTLITVVGPGEMGPVTDGDPDVDGTSVSQPMSTDLPAGNYTVTWRVTSSDGHPISGEFDYSVGSAGPEAQGSESSDAAEGGTTRDDAASTGTQRPPPPESADRTGADRAADTAAAPAQGDASGGSGTAWWVWGVLALAIVTIGGLGAVAIRRR